MGIRVEGVTEASLTSDVFVACLFQFSCRGLAGLRGCVPGSENCGGGDGGGGGGEGHPTVGTGGGGGSPRMVRSGKGRVEGGF